jgi:L-aspartate oxidase
MRDAERIRADYAVIGAGVAGLRAAIELASGGKVLLLSKGSLEETATAAAHRGISAAPGDEEEPGIHEQETLRAGAGLANSAAVRALVEEGPRRLAELAHWGAQTGRANHPSHASREAQHGRSRGLASHPESTGCEIARTLLGRVRALDGIELRVNSFTIELETKSTGGNTRVTGLHFLDENSGRLMQVEARAVLLATGGLGQLYPETTNPASATGDGMAIGFRAGAALGDMEFVEFHPTALAAKNAPPIPLSDALCGEGAVLRNALLERFLPHYHECAELAPRDALARAITSEMKRTESSHVYLDLTGLDPDHVTRLFPRILTRCMDYGIDITTDMVPVRPAAHYSIGGLRTDLEGRTTLACLYAAGETAATGVHGACRLPGNSLLEGLVFGARAAKAMLADAASASQEGRSRTRAEKPGPRAKNIGPEPGVTASNPDTGAASRPAGTSPEPALAKLRGILSESAGILREGRELARAVKQLDAMAMERPQSGARREWEIYNLWTLARVVARSALARRESRGNHYRADFPYPDDELFARHSLAAGDGPVRFV